MTSTDAELRTREACERAAQALDAGNVDSAIAELESIPNSDRSSEVWGLLGLAQFRASDYDAAAKALAGAGTEDPRWVELLDRARANAEAEIQVFVPEVTFYERDALLAPPGPVQLPTPPPHVPQKWFPRTRRLLGNGLGFAVSFVVDVVTQAVGRIGGYRDEVWTNWYRKRLTFGILTLGYMRTLLNRNNLRNTYPKGQLVGFQQPGQAPPEGVTHFRTADGTWNNLEDPKEGAAGTRFPRNVRDSAVKPETGDRLLTPNPRAISLRLLGRRGPMKEVPFLNMLAASWINFQNHDWISHGQNLTNEIVEIPLADDDPARTMYRQRNMFIGKTQPDPTRRSSGEPTPITFINEVTHWWDGSQIYGSDQATVDRLRSHVDGKLRLNGDGTLPVGRNGVEESGFIRDWWVGLSMLHTLFAREHNAICDELKRRHPGWDDERLFGVARLVNAAVMAKIHSVEWTPAILPNQTLADALNANWYGVLTNVFRRGPERRTLAPFNVRNPEMGGVVGNPINKHGQPYGLTQEFVEVYRLHSLLPETLAIRRISGGEEVEPVSFPASRQAGSVKLSKRFPMADLFFSFGTQHPGQLVLRNYPRFLQELSVPGNPVFDMAAVDILRARERGVPRYNEFRRQLGLNPIRTWLDLTTDPDSLAGLKELYGEGGVESLDLLVGTLAEETRPTGFGFGETLFQIFILNASRRLQADRFFTDSYNAQTYSQEGLDWIDRADLKSVPPPPLPRAGEHGPREREERVRTVGRNVAAGPRPPPSAWLRPRTQEGPLAAKGEREVIVAPGSASRFDKGLHGAFAAAQRFERRFEPFFRPALNAVLREPSAAVIQALINRQRPNLGLGLAEERKLPNEDETIDRMIATIAAYMRSQYTPGEYQRGGNTKTHAIVRAEFVVHENIPKHLRHGVFAEPRTFPAWVRFSGPGPDSPKDIDDVGFASIAIKLMGVPGPKLMDDEKETQDFTAVCTPTFVTPDIDANIQLQTEILKYTPGLYFFRPRSHHFLDVLMQSWWNQTQSNPLGVRYWSCVPYLLGEGQAMQYSVKPKRRIRTRIPRLPRRPPDNYLRDATAATLAKTGVEFDFMLQVQVDAHRMPVENNAVRWPEKLSPFVPVATLRIPQQTFDTPAQMGFAHNLSYNPWHCLPEHRPLGNQSRARLKMYYELSKLRQSENKTPHIEPTGEERFD